MYTSVGTENAKRDKEERDRARSRVRDSSRPKREPSISQRDRDRDEPRERPRDRDRDGYRREASRSRRDRDEQEDSRHWRDDGKRDERIAARRERERARPNQERESDDRRWVAGDDRDGRYKRTGRERKALAVGDEGREKDDRREKDKEPAWMDTYIPSESSSGILGGQAPNGELDGIQAWKKGLKEKGIKEKEPADMSANSKVVTDQPLSSMSDLTEKPLDEIQLFRMLMKKEEDKKRLEEDASVGLKEANPVTRDDIVGQAHELVVTSTFSTCLTHEGNLKDEKDDLNNGPTSAQSKTPLPSLDSPSTSSVQSLGLKDPAILSSVKGNSDSLQERFVGHRSTVSPDLTIGAGKSSVEIAGNTAFPAIGSRVLAMKNKAGLPQNIPINIQNLNGRCLSILIYFLCLLIFVLFLYRWTANSYAGFTSTLR